MPLLRPRDHQISRRHFIGGASAAAVAGALGGNALVGRALAREVRKPSDAAWRRLAERLSGPVLRSGSFDLGKYARSYNLRYADDLPDGIALCRNADDVAAAIAWCRDESCPLVVQAGGHSYAGYSMRRSGLMINLMLMRSAVYRNGAVTVAGGVRNQDLYALLAQHGTATTHGRCPTVGAAGFLLGGGIGFNMRAHDIACSQLMESEIVTANGRITTIKPGNAPEADLFWACQGGGGGNFGINTSFTLQTFEARPVTVFDLTWDAATPDPREVFGKLMPALTGGPDELGTRVSLKAPRPGDRRLGADVTINLIGQLGGGTPRVLDQILADVYAVSRPQKSMIWNEAPYWDAQKLLEDTDAPTFFQERSAFLKSSLGDDALDIAFRHLRDWPGTSGSADLRFFQTGGKMNKVAVDATAFVHRNTQWILDVGLSWNDQERWDAVARSRLWQDRFYDAMRRFSTGGAYQNFVDPSLDDWREAYYGDNLQRLQRIKQAVDPDRVFAFPQAI
jgi:FAD/FMN-containing dehydrogenase